MTICFTAGRTARRLAAILLLAALAAALLAGCGGAGKERKRAAALKMADFILSLQEENGAIRDAADAETVNADSNMEYALIALAAAYGSSGEEKYLSGLERGIAWLADAEETEDGPWRGSWWYVCDRRGDGLPSSRGGADVRGVDSTSALFVYLLYLDRMCTGSETFISGYRGNAEAALDFILTKSRTEDGFTAGFFQRGAAGEWSRCGCCYSADQGDVWLGLRAGALLYGNDEYARAAELLKEKVPGTFFSEERRRYCAGMEDGAADWSEDGFSPVQSQGFLPWLWGDTEQNREAVGWLRKRMDGDLSGEYYLSAAFLALGEQGLGRTLSDKSGEWLLESGIDEKTGGVYDSPRDRTEWVNTAAFCALALFEWPAGV